MPWIVAGTLLTASAAAFGAYWLHADTQVEPAQLQAAMSSAMAEGMGPGLDPICVANGLAYDQSPVNVEADNMLTVSWMNTLVSAGLYQAEPGARETQLPAQAAGQETAVADAGLLPPGILTYLPLPVLADWAGPRRLCIAKSVRLLRVANVGEVMEFSLRGKRYAGVAADVVWTLDRPAAWLSQAEVGDTFARELPVWRNARWEPSGKSWRLTQRKNFYRVGDRWVTGEVADRITPSPAEGSAAL